VCGVGCSVRDTRHGDLGGVCVSGGRNGRVFGAPERKTRAGPVRRETIERLFMINVVV